MRSILPFLFVLVSVCSASGQGLVVNEFSNGTTGVQEFVEFVVVGTGPGESCGPVDIRGWIFDDNNGDFSCGPCTGTGIATGHLRFSNHPRWSAVPVGSIIVVFNDADINPLVPAPDPDDIAPADGVYIVPSNDPGIESSTGTACGVGNRPNAIGSCPSCTGGVGTYLGSCYTVGSFWNNAGLRNTGDAMQVRRTDGTYFHGIAYNASAGNTGGPDNLLFSVTGANRTFFLTNNLNNNYRLIGNYLDAAAGSATPGVANSPNNAAWINFLQTDCLLPVEYALPLQGTPTAEGNRLAWATLRETNSSHFVVERAGRNDGPFTSIGFVPAVGNSIATHHYTFQDPQPDPVTFYRLAQVDLDGRTIHSDVVEVVALQAAGPALQLWPQPVGDKLHVKATGRDIRAVVLLDPLGREVAVRAFPAGTHDAETAFDLQDRSAGLYVVQVRTHAGTLSQKVFHLD